MHVAATLGYKFTILTPGEKRIPAKYNDTWRNKLPYNLASVRPLGMTVTGCGVGFAVAIVAPPGIRRG